MMKKVFIDGSNGTTGLRIYDRLLEYKEVELITLPEELRKNTEARLKAINSSDITFLCLPDEAAKEVVQKANENVIIIDTSTAHRTEEAFAYGFPELGEPFLEKIKSSNRIAVPGCHASGFIALIYPLIEEGIISKDEVLSCFSLTGYSGGGKKMISEYEDINKDVLLDSPRQYGIKQNHKHLKEMQAICKLNEAPIFSPVVASYYSGMEVTVFLSKKQIKGSIEDIKNIYRKKYNDEFVTYVESLDDKGFIACNKLSGYDNMLISCEGNEDRIILIALYDNLGKGASGAALECMNIKLGFNKKEGLNLWKE